MLVAYATRVSSTYERMDLNKHIRMYEPDGIMAYFRFDVYVIAWL